MSWVFGALVVGFVGSVASMVAIGNRGERAHRLRAKEWRSLLGAVAERPIRGLAQVPPDQPVAVLGTLHAREPRYDPIFGEPVLEHSVFVYRLDDEGSSLLHREQPEAPELTVRDGELDVTIHGPRAARWTPVYASYSDRLQAQVRAYLEERGLPTANVLVSTHRVPAGMRARVAGLVEPDPERREVHPAGYRGETRAAARFVGRPDRPVVIEERRGRR